MTPIIPSFTQSTIYFIGVSNSQSSLMWVFPKWMDILNQPTRLVGFDTPLAIYLKTSIVMRPCAIRCRVFQSGLGGWKAGQPTSYRLIWLGQICYSPAVSDGRTRRCCVLGATARRSPSAYLSRMR